MPGRILYTSNHGSAVETRSNVLYAGRGRFLHHSACCATTGDVRKIASNKMWTFFILVGGDARFVMYCGSYQGIASAMPKALWYEYAFRRCIPASLSLLTVAHDHDLPFVFAHTLQRNLDIPLLPQARELFSPLNQQNAVVGAQVVQRERFQFASRVRAVKIAV